jgi:hypothetical protein
MRFNVAFKQVEEGQAVGRIQNSGRVYPCTVCGARTLWVDISDTTMPPPHLCSDECLDAYDSGTTVDLSSPRSTPAQAAGSTFDKGEERVVVEVVNPDGGASAIPLESFLA